jgi:hypothetical protein
MTVRSGDGQKLGHVEAVTADGFQIAGGPAARWEDVIEVRDGEVYVSAHRPELGERTQEAPRD